MLSHEDNERTGQGREGDTPRRAVPALLDSVFAFGRPGSRTGSRNVSACSARISSPSAIPTAASAWSTRPAPIGEHRSSSAATRIAGLRCVYHGWKFDVSGACTDMPATSRPKATSRRRCGINAYPCQERQGWSGSIWDRRQTPPPLPDLEGNSCRRTRCMPPRVSGMQLGAGAGRRPRLIACRLAHGRLDVPIPTARAFQYDIRPPLKTSTPSFGASQAAGNGRRSPDWHRHPVRASILTRWSPPPIPVRCRRGPGCRSTTRTRFASCSPITRPTIGRRPARSSKRGTMVARAGTPVGIRWFKSPSPCRTLNHWTKYNPQNGFQFDYDAAADDLVLGVAGALGAGWCLRKRCFADL